MTRRWTRRRRVIAVVAVILGTAVLGACSSDDDAAFTPVAGSDSAYCATYRAWKVYELDNGEAFDQPSPTALRKFWNAYLIAEETLLQQAPREIRDEVAIKVGFIRTRLTPLMERYGFDLERTRNEGNAAEQATLFQTPPAEVQKAQGAQYAYEDRTCGTRPSPPAADVVFEAGPSSKSFCAALSALDRELEKIVASRFDPNVMRAFVTGDRFTDVMDGLDASAPAEIEVDVEADTDWFRTRWSDVVARYGYDLRRIYLDATPEDLAVFNRTHPDVLEHTSQDTAYEEQVCDD
jgi:hypothetical protein